MHTQGLLQVFSAWQLAGLRYLVVGGYAVIAHGYLRSTHDLDIIVDFADEQMQSLVQSLESMGFVPRAPVPLSDLADAEKRRQWVEDKGAEVFSVRRTGSSGLPDEVDIFLTHPFDFHCAYKEALVQELPGAISVPFVDRQRLLDMKRAAGRPRDWADIAALEATA